MKTKLCQRVEEYCVQIRDGDKLPKLSALAEPSYAPDKGSIYNNEIRIKPETLGLSDSDFERRDVKKIGIALRNKIKERGVVLEGDIRNGYRQ